MIWLQKIQSFYWKEIFVFKTLFDINDISDTVGVGVRERVPGCLDILGLNHFAIWIDLVLEAKVNTVLSFLDSSNE